jgi:hypothetical protein
MNSPVCYRTAFFLLVKVVQGGSRLFKACGVQSNYIPLFHIPGFQHSPHSTFRRFYVQALKARNMSAQGEALCNEPTHKHLRR